MAIWLNLDPPRDDIGFIISSGGNSIRVDKGGFALFYRPYSPRIGAVVRVRDGNNGTAWRSEEYGVEYGEWFHVAVTWQKYGYLRFYLNGILQGVTPSEHYTPYTPVRINSDMHLGKRNHQDDYYANVTMDELKLYAIELTEPQVKQILGSRKCILFIFTAQTHFNILQIFVDLKSTMRKSNIKTESILCHFQV